MSKCYNILSTLVILLSLYSNTSKAIVAPNSLWQKLSDEHILQSSSDNINSKTKTGNKLELTIEALRQTLLNNKVVVVNLPLPNGSFVKFELTSSDVLHPQLATKYPSIKTFTGVEVGNSKNKGHFDITPKGFHGVFSYQGQSILIDPIFTDNNRYYQSYYKKDAVPVDLTLKSKRLPPIIHSQKTLTQAKTSAKTTSNSLTTFRIAIATTGEYATFHGGTKTSTLAALTTLVTRLNEVYQRDLSIAFQLVANNDSIIFTDSDTDPFSNTDEDISVNQTVIDDTIGVNNYDIGHVVGTGAGGLASLGVVCGELQPFKAEGVTGLPQPTSDVFYIDFVAHEIGHQFGAEHIFNGIEDGCGGNRAALSAYEPGSGSTIMSYAGLCGSQNLQNAADDYFHIHSIDQIRAHITQASCGSSEVKTNSGPVVNAGNNYTIPAKTPFTLVGEATDADNDSLTYSWEQYDLGGATNNASEDAIDDGQKPLFRTFEPTNSPKRTLPKLADILANNTRHGETLPTKSRELNFRLVVRDNQQNLTDDAMKITVVEVDEGFSVNEISSWNSKQQTITWHTANTENAPVSCATVDILLSTDSGINFDTLLGENVSNNGSFDVTLPNMVSDTARVKIACRDNIFFAINNADFAININDVIPPKPVFVSQNSIAVDENSTIVLTTDMFTFADNVEVDNITLHSGNNYTFNNTTLSPNNDFNGSLSVNMSATKSGVESDIFQVAVTVIAAPVTPPTTPTTSSSSGGTMFYLLLFLVLPLVKRIRNA